MTLCQIQSLALMFLSAILMFVSWIAWQAMQRDRPIEQRERHNLRILIRALLRTIRETPGALDRLGRIAAADTDVMRAMEEIDNV